MRLIYPLFLMLATFTVGFGQNQRFIHQTFQMDTATTLRLDLYGKYSVETWAGDAIMIESKVSLYDASEGILKYLIDQGRYEVEAKLEGNELSLVSKDKVRNPVGTSRGVSKEEITTRVFIPEKLQPAGASTWTRPKEEEKKTLTTKGEGG